MIPALTPGMCFPTRESDGEWHVGTMVDTRQLRIKQSRENAAKFLQHARACRLAGNSFGFEWALCRARSWRKEYAEVRS